MTNYSESELIPFALAAINETPKGIETQLLIKKLAKVMKPNGEDKIILINRTDDKFSQKVRNLKSHKTLEKKEYVIFKDNKFYITDKGISYLKNHTSLISNVIEISKHKVENYEEKIDFDSLLTQVLSTLTPKEERVFRYRFGVNSYSHTLEEIGKIFKVTRERIRQIETKILRKLKHPSRGKMMKRVLVKISEVLNSIKNILNEEEFLKKLQNKNISLKSLRLLRIVLNVYDFSQDNIHYYKGKFYVTESDNYFNSFLLFINKYYNSVRTKNGIVNINLLHSELRRKNFLISNSIVRDLINNRNGYYINDDYFIPNTKGKNNRLTGVIKFTMSVSDKVEIDELSECIKRSRNLEIFSPPNAVLKSLCEKLGFEVSDNFILNKSYSKDNNTLTGNNKALFNMFNENNRVMTYEEILEENKKYKINVNSLNVLIYQNLFTQPRRMIFALAGTSLDDEYLDDLDKKRQTYIKEITNQIEYSQGSTNGSITISFPTIYSYKPYMWMNPDYYNLIPEGQYEVAFEGKTKHLNIFRNRIWFKNIFFKNLDLDKNSFIKLSIDLIEKRAEFSKIIN